MATNSKADISQTETFFWIFSFVTEIYVKFRIFLPRKDQSHSLSIREIIKFETSIYLIVQKAIFHARLRNTTC